ncbi:MAG: hypothetical protein ABSB84_03360 [Verrucomicrobiota bacterium]|jgi:hypothetical protein
MRIPKLFSVVCVVAFCAGFITIRAEDTPAQAAARAALMEKMNALEAQPAQPAPPPPIVVTPSGAVPEQPTQPTNAVVAPTPAVPVQPVIRAPKTKAMPATKAAQTTPTPSNMEAQTKAPAALKQKTSKPNRQEWTNPRFAPPAPQTQPVATSPVKPAPPATKPEVMSPPQQINANLPGKELGLKPIAAPPVPISAAKEAQLQALLAKYKADQITPEQYHAERAKILAEP